MGGMLEKWKDRVIGSPEKQGHGLVLNEACDFLCHLRMIFRKVIIGIRYISGIGGISVMKKHVH